LEGRRTRPINTITGYNQVLYTSDIILAGESEYEIGVFGRLIPHWCGVDIKGVTDFFKLCADCLERTGREISGRIGAHCGPGHQIPTSLSVEAKVEVERDAELQILDCTGDI
jgi:hypothetical protein